MQISEESIDSVAIVLRAARRNSTGVTRGRSVAVSHNSNAWRTWIEGGPLEIYGPAPERII